MHPSREETRSAQQERSLSADLSQSLIGGDLLCEAIQVVCIVHRDIVVVLGTGSHSLGTETTKGIVNAVWREVQFVSTINDVTGETTLSLTGAWRRTATSSSIGTDLALSVTVAEVGHLNIATFKIKT